MHGTVRLATGLPGPAAALIAPPTWPGRSLPVRLFTASTAVTTSIPDRSGQPARGERDTAHPAAYRVKSVFVSRCDPRNRAIVPAGGAAAGLAASSWPGACNTNLRPSGTGPQGRVDWKAPAAGRAAGKRIGVPIARIHCVAEAGKPARRGGEAGGTRRLEVPGGRIRPDHGVPGAMALRGGRIGESRHRVQPHRDVLQRRLRVLLRLCARGPCQHQQDSQPQPPPGLHPTRARV